MNQKSKTKLERTLLEKRSIDLLETVKKELSLENIMESPRLEKVTINFCLGSFLKKGGDIDNAIEILTLISGQKPTIVKARCSVANFKLREGMNSALKVTLRKKRMFWFLERLLYIALPRTYNFWGLKETAHDGKKCFSLGLNDLSVFPEIGSRFSMKGNPGVNIIFGIQSKSVAHSLHFLKTMDFPFVGQK